MYKRGHRFIPKSIHVDLQEIETVMKACGSTHTVFAVRAGGDRRLIHSTKHTLATRPTHLPTRSSLQHHVEWMNRKPLPSVTSHVRRCTCERGSSKDRRGPIRHSAQQMKARQVISASAIQSRSSTKPRNTSLLSVNRTSRGEARAGQRICCIPLHNHALVNVKPVSR